MSLNESDRPADEAIAWVAQLVGGKLVRQERQARWRPAYFLDFEMPDGEIKKTLLRGYRAPILADPEKDIEKTTLTLHRREAGREYLFKPVQKVTGVASHWPMQRIF